MSCLSVALRSGSSGNATFIRTESARLIVDVGMNGKQFALALDEFDEHPDDIDGILITHEHTDHISGLGVVMRRHKIPVYMTLLTLEAVLPVIGRVDQDLLHLIVPGNPFSIKETEILPFSISHDAVDPVGYRVKSRHGDVAVLTDTGVVTEQIFSTIKGVRTIFLEANYDYNMLWEGNYPLHLKRRIAGSDGHLDNRDAAQMAVQLLTNGTEAISLSHLSAENNMPLLARRTVGRALAAAGAEVDKDIILQTSKRYSCSDPIEWK